MGTQQILLIVLSVIIVGAAIAVGITMFNNQAFSANKSALAADTQSFGTQIIQYYKTPTSQGGNGRDLATMTAPKIASYIGWTNAAGETVTENGTYRITAAGANEIKISGLGKELKSTKYPLVTTTIKLSTGEITSVLGEATLAELPAIAVAAG